MGAIEDQQSQIKKALSELFSEMNSTIRILRKKVERYEKIIEKQNRRCKTLHTKYPNDIAYHDWAERKVKTHKQIRCPDCGSWAIWVKKG